MTAWRDGWLAGVDGKRLYWQAWTPAEAPTGVVVLAHGVNEHSGRYRHVGERLARHGLAVYALDHRGHGRSDGRRAYVERLELAVADLRAFVARVRAEHANGRAAAPGDGRPGASGPGRPGEVGEQRPFLIGHSMGGAIAASYALRDGDALAGLVLSGPAVATEAVSPALRAISQVLSALAPRLPVYQIDASLISRDAAVVRAFLEDPLVHTGKLPARTLGEITHAMQTLPDLLATLRMPLLLLHGTEDGLCPPEGSRMIHDRAASEDRALELYDGLYHEVLNEPERERVIDDLSAWLLERAGR